MARTLEFDYPKAIERATRLFWKSGYAGTSLRGLLRAMGIGEGSFYNTVKSKKRAYLECLKHYSLTIGRHRGEAFFSAPTAASGIRALFKTVLDCLDDPGTPSRLCLMAGSVNRDVLAEPDLRRYVYDQLSTAGGADDGATFGRQASRIVATGFGTASGGADRHYVSAGVVAHGACLLRSEQV